MRLKDQFTFVRQNVKKNRIRLFMTVLATAIGVTFLIVLASLGFGLQKTIVKDAMEQQIVTEIQVYGHETEESEFRSLTSEDITYLESLDNVEAVTRKIQLGQLPTYAIDDYQIDASTMVTHFPSEIEAGFELSEGSLPEADDEIVVGYHFAEFLIQSSADSEEIYNEQGEVKEEFQYNGPLVGETIEMTIRKTESGQKQSEVIPLKVVGISAIPASEWTQDMNVYISEEVYSQVENFTGTPKGIASPEEASGVESTAGTYDHVFVYGENLESVEEITNQLQTAGYAVYSVVSEMEQVNILFTIVEAVLILVGTIAVLIASIGIFNTMTMAVTERAPDIGIMKAVGANPRTIKQIFLLESSYIGILGAVMGTIAAYIISILINLGVPMIIEAATGEELPGSLQFSSIPLSLVFIAMAICLGVTILSGMRPAKRATEVDVLKAMRREV